jgi:hypothetical protein
MIKNHQWDTNLILSLARSLCSLESTENAELEPFVFLLRRQKDKNTHPFGIKNRCRVPPLWAGSSTGVENKKFEVQSVKNREQRAVKSKW